MGVLKFLFFGGITSFSVGVSTAVIRLFIKQPSRRQLQPTNNEKNVTIKIDRTQGQPNSEQDISSISTPATKMMHCETNTDFMYDFTMCTGKHEGDFYSDESFPQRQAPESDSLSSFTNTGSLSIEKYSKKTQDKNIIVVEAFPEYEVLVLSKNMARSHNGTTDKPAVVNSEKLETHKITLVKVFVVNTTQCGAAEIASGPLIMKPLQTNISKQPITRAAQGTVSGTSIPNNIDEDVRTKLLDFTNRESKRIDSSKVVSEIVNKTVPRSENGSVESYMEELFEDVHIKRPLKASAPYNTAAEEPINGESITEVIGIAIYKHKMSEESVKGICVGKEYDTSILKNIVVEKPFRNACTTREHRILIPHHEILEVRTKDNCIMAKSENVILQDNILMECGERVHKSKEHNEPTRQNQIPEGSNESVRLEKKRNVPIQQCDVSERLVENVNIPKKHLTSIPESESPGEVNRGIHNMEESKAVLPRQEILAQDTQNFCIPNERGASTPQNGSHKESDNNVHVTEQSDGFTPQDKVQERLPKETHTPEVRKVPALRNESRKETEEDVHDMEESKAFPLQSNLLEDHSRQAFSYKTSEALIAHEKVLERRTAPSIFNLDKTVRDKNFRFKQAFHILVPSLPRERELQTDKTTSLFPQSTPNKEAKSSVYDPQAGISPYSNESSPTYLSTMPRRAKPISEIGKIMLASKKRVTNDMGAVVALFSSTETTDEPVPDSCVSTTFTPVPSPCPQSGEKRSTAVTEGAPQAIVTMSPLHRLTSVWTSTGDVSLPMATGIVNRATMARSLRPTTTSISSPLPTCAPTKGSENIEREMNRIMIRRESRVDEGRDKKRFRLWKRIRMVPRHLHRNKKRQRVDEGW